MKKIWYGVLVLCLASASVNAMEDGVVAVKEVEIEEDILKVLEEIEVDVNGTVWLLGKAEKQDDDGDARSEETEQTGLELTGKHQEKIRIIAVAQVALNRRAKDVGQISAALDAEEKSLVRYLENEKLTKNDVQDVERRLEKLLALPELGKEDLSIEESLLRVDSVLEEEDSNVQEVLGAYLSDHSKKLRIMQEGIAQNVEGCKERIVHLQSLVEKAKKKKSHEKNVLNKAQKDSRIIRDRLLVHNGVYKEESGVTKEKVEDLQVEKEKEEKEALHPVVVPVDGVPQGKSYNFCAVL